MIQTLMDRRSLIFHRLYDLQQRFSGVNITGWLARNFSAPWGAKHANADLALLSPLVGGTDLVKFMRERLQT